MKMVAIVFVPNDQNFHKLTLQATCDGALHEALHTERFSCGVRASSSFG